MNSTLPLHVNTVLLCQEMKERSDGLGLDVLGVMSVIDVAPSGDNFICPINCKLFISGVLKPEKLNCVMTIFLKGPTTKRQSLGTTECTSTLERWGRFTLCLPFDVEVTKDGSYVLDLECEGKLVHRLHFVVRILRLTTRQSKLVH